MVGSSGRPIQGHARRTLAVALAAAPLLGVPAYAVNYVPNPSFESCVQDAMPSSWAPVGADQATCDGTQANTGAFSLALSNPATSMAGAQSDCIVVSPNTFIPTFRFAYRTAASDVVQVALTVRSYGGTDCTGSSGVVSAGAGFSFGTPISTDGTWQTLPAVSVLLDATSHSLRFTASFQVNTPAANSIVHFDDIEFVDAPVGTTSTTSLPGSTTTSTTLPVSFPGTGKAATECYVTFEGIAAGRLDCTDGDPACDADGAANGTCHFAFRVCAAQSVAGCQTATVTSLKATPTPLAIPLPPVPASTPACGAPAQVAVPLRRSGRRPGRVSVAFVAKSDGKPKRERDVLRFRCLPPA